MNAPAPATLLLRLVGLLALLVPALLPAQFTVDGQLGSDPYGTPLAVQENTTQFGDNLDPDILAADGSELDAIYARISGDRLYLLVTGNLETNFNKLNLFFDSRPGGQHSLLPGNPDIDLGSLKKLEGLTFDAGFEADFFLTVGGGNAGGSGITFFLNFAELYVDGANPGNGIYLGETGAGNTAFPVGLSDGVQFGINNSNTAGVMAGAAVGNPGDVTTGIELSIPLALLGNPAGAIQVCAFIGSPDNAFLSNQVLGSLPLSTPNLGSPAPVNFSGIAGDQFVTVPASDDLVINLNSGQSHTSLAAAVAAAVSGDTLTFVASLAGGEIALSSQVLIDKNLTIDGSGLPGGLALIAGAGARHFEVAPDSTATLKGLALIDSTATGNGGAILNRGTLTVEACLFRNNSATGNGGAIEGPGGSSTTVLACTFDGNTASDGGAIAHAGSASVTHSTFHNNTAAGYGGAIFNFENSLTIEGSTFAANAAATGDDISLLSFGTPPTLTLINSIVAEASEGAAPGSPASFTGTVNLIGGTPLLAPLGDYGGPTPTMPPLPGSPAIDPVGGDTSSPFSTDQRGLSRAIGGIIDIGAVETGNADSGFNVVNRLDDDVTGAGNGVSLREAILFGDPAENITFDPLLDAGTLTLTNGQLLLDRSFTIDGTPLANGFTISGNGIYRHFEITDGSTVTLNRLKFTDGFADFGGSVLNRGRLTVVDSTFSDNVATINGGAINGNEGATTVILRSTFVRNQATDGGAVAIAGGTSVEFSTFAGNSATGIGGAVFNFDAQLIVTHATITGNTAAEGGGIGAFDGGGGPTLEVYASIVSNNSASTDPNIPGLLTGESNYTGNEPDLAPLGYYGGPTPTMPPLPGSPAINGASGSYSGSPTDQRGAFYGADGPFDLGAVQIQDSEASNLVNSIEATGPGSLRNAIAFGANPATAITFDTGLSGQIIDLGGSRILITRDIAVDASGLAGGLTLSGGNRSRHFEIEAGTTATLIGLTLTDGAANGNGGSILNAGDLTVSQSTFADNSASGNGGAIEGPLNSVTTINASTFQGNSGNDGGAIAHAGTASVTNSTFFNNTAIGFGGGIFNFQNTLTVESSTLTGNTAATGGGISLFNPISFLVIDNCIVAGNTATTDDDVSGFFPAGNNLVGGTPLLAPLGDYGGPTPTMPPLPGSPVIDAAVPAPVDLAVWTFETSQPGLDNSQAITGIAPESGPASATASGFHASSSTDYSNPVGNGSAESFSSNNWAVGDYYQFTVPGIGRGAFVLSFEHTSSGTGPAEFTLEYSVDGENFSAFADYTVLQNGGWNNNPAPPDPYLPGYAFSFDLSGVTILNDQPLVHFRLTCRSDLAARGDTVGSAGTSRVDDVTIRAQFPDQRGLLRPNGPLPDIGAVEAYPFALLQLVSSDGDGIPDILKEAGAPYAHLDGINGSSVDTDGDGSSDAEEFANMTDLFDASDSFRVLAFDVDPATGTAASITISTFPGLSYAFEAGDTLLEGDFLT
jgi:predicted outer membrane repeat protein